MTNARQDAGGDLVDGEHMYDAGPKDAGSGDAGEEGGAGDGSPGDGGGGESDAGTGEGDAQTPPQGAVKLAAWLKKGDYKKWRCEGKVHKARSPSAHDFNRVCANILISSNAKKTGQWPEGAAAVKELYATVDSKVPLGYAVSLKTKPRSAMGANWYWFETVAKDPSKPAGAQDIIADGLGKARCVGCHGTAASGATDPPVQGSRDFVFTPVP